MKKFFKEPLLHFIVLGALIYVASMTWGNIDDQQQNIVISQGKIRHLATLFMKTWQRSPTQKELSSPEGVIIFTSDSVTLVSPALAINPL